MNVNGKKAEGPLGPVPGKAWIINEMQASHLAPWAWAVAWLLTNAGFTLSDLYSSPHRSLVPYFALSAVGWGAAVIVTAGIGQQGLGSSVRLASWAIAYLAATIPPLFWLQRWNMGWFGPIIGVGIAGVIGGIFGSSHPGVWRLASGALLGMVFLLLAALSFYTGYIILVLGFPLLAAVAGYTGAAVILWGVPAGFCGLGAGLMARSILGYTPGGSIHITH
jgi:hypothetical protein